MFEIKNNIIKGFKKKTKINIPAYSKNNKNNKLINISISYNLKIKFLKAY